MKTLVVAVEGSGESRWKEVKRAQKSGIFRKG